MRLLRGVAALVLLGSTVSACGPASASPKWTVAASPPVAGGGRGALAAVSCTSATNCFAVGDYTHGSLKTYGVRWNGTKWAVVPTPNPKGSTSSRLFGVSCPTATRCFAVGTYREKSYKTLVERWDGTRWAIMSSPERGGATDSQLLAVSCTATANCFAVGRYRGASGPRQTLIEHYDGRGWTIVPSPSARAGNNYLSGVSCASTTSCTAVGTYFPSSSCEPELDCSANTLVVRFNGKHWVIVASANGNRAFQSRLDGVSCTGAASCVAVGTSYPDPPSSWKMLTERWNGKTWAVIAGAVPTGVTRSALYGVSCTGPTSCVAGGAYQQHGADLVIVERFNGTKWSIAYRPGAAGLLRGLSCTSTTSCVAVGGGVIARLAPV